MGGSLSPVLANIIMTEFEEVAAENLIKTGIVTFCARYVDDTLLVVKRKNIDFILQKLSSFDKSLKFTINTFEHCVPDFPDIEICLNGLGIYRNKNTQTGQYTNINSSRPWKWKTSWITSLVVRAKRICCNRNLNKEIWLIKNIASWNGFAKNISNSRIKKALKSKSNVSNTPSVSTASTKIFFNLQYSGDTTEQMVKSCIKKLSKCLKMEDANIKFIVCYKTTKMFFYTNTKDKTPLWERSHIT